MTDLFSGYWTRIRITAGRKVGLPLTMAVMALAWILVTGRYIAVVDPDTDSYLVAGTPGHFLDGSRAPTYGWILDAFQWHHWMAMPAIHALLFGASAGFLMEQIKRTGGSLYLAAAVGFSAILSNAFFLNAHDLVPETLGLGACMAAFSGGLIVARRQWAGYAVVAVAAGLAYTLRPIMLPLIFVLPVFVFVVSRSSSRLRVALLTLVASSVPFLAFSTVRLVEVGDFNVASFGGFQASGLSSLMLSPQLLANLDKPNKELASKLEAAIAQRETEGLLMGVPENPHHARSFAYAAVYYPDVLAYTYDQVLYNVVGSVRRHGENWVSFNRRLMNFDIAVFRAEPGLFVLWVGGQTARLVGQGIILNGAMFLAVIGTLFGIGVKGQTTNIDLRLAIALTLGWLVANGLFAVTVSYAAQRYIYSATMFLSLLPASWAARCIASRLVRPWPV